MRGSPKPCTSKDDGPSLFAKAVARGGLAVASVVTRKYASCELTALASRLLIVGAFRKSPKT